MKRRERLLVARGIAIALGSTSAGFALVFVLVSVARGRTWWSELWWSLLVEVLTMVLLGGIITVINLVVGRKRENTFQVLARAMQRIASGDFDVTVPVEDTRPDVGQMVSGLNEMAVSLKKMEAMRQEFVSDVSHEIQSPLTSIGGFARALQDEGLPLEQRLHYLGIIEAESRRLSVLSDSLLRLSALDARTQELSLVPFRLDAQLRSSVLACESQWRGKRINVSAELSTLTVAADEAMLAQVWANLLHNAVKFTPEGGAIIVSLSQRDGQALITVRDTGIGIAAEDLPHVFERFFKADKSRTSANGPAGNGLGLAIAHRIVSLHGGTITVESGGMGRGTCFAVRLPLQQAVETPGEPASPGPGGTGVRGPRQSPRRPAGV